MKELGQRVQKLRQERGLTRNQLARSLQYKPSVIRDLEYGVRVKELARLLPDIANYFDVSLGFLFGVPPVEAEVSEIARKIEGLAKRLHNHLQDLS